MPDYNLKWTMRSSAILAGQWLLRANSAKRSRAARGSYSKDRCDNLNQKYSQVCHKLVCKICSFLRVSKLIFLRSHQAVLKGYRFVQLGRELPRNMKHQCLSIKKWGQNIYTIAVRDNETTWQIIEKKERIKERMKVRKKERKKE